MDAHMFEKTDQLIDQITAEITRIWGEEGPDGTEEEYVWLAENYGITEEDDVRWINVITHVSGDTEAFNEAYPEGDSEREEVLTFLEDPDAVYAFLETLLKRYQSNTVSYPQAE